MPLYSWHNGIKYDPWILQHHQGSEYRLYSNYGAIQSGKPRDPLYLAARALAAAKSALAQVLQSPFTPYKFVQYVVKPAGHAVYDWHTPINPLHF